MALFGLWWDSSMLLAGVVLLIVSFSWRILREGGMVVVIIAPLEWGSSSPSSARPVHSLQARWRWRQGGSSQLPKKEVVNVASFVNYCGYLTTVTQQTFSKTMCCHAVHPGGDGPRWRPLIAHLAATKFLPAI
jgi:hypothetical protein